MAATVFDPDPIGADRKTPNCYRGESPGGTERSAARRSLRLGVLTGGLTSLR